MRICPLSKYDDEACENLAKASDEEVLQELDSLLEWTEDLNWPVAWPVVQRLAKLGIKLVPSLRIIFQNDDYHWQYFIISGLLTETNRETVIALIDILGPMAWSPNETHLLNELDEVTLDLFQDFGITEEDMANKEK